MKATDHLPGDDFRNLTGLPRCPDCGVPNLWKDTCPKCGWHIRCVNRADGKVGKKNPSRPARWRARKQRERRLKSFDEIA